jgi:hypothetical protein
MPTERGREASAASAILEIGRKNTRERAPNVQFLETQKLPTLDFGIPRRLPPISAGNGSQKNDRRRIQVFVLGRAAY